jgi:hypothetical protein
MKRSVVTGSSGMGLALCILCMALSSNAQNPHHQGYYPNFPRLGMIYIGGDQTYPASTWPIMAKFNVVIMGGGRETWGDNRAWTREDVIQGVHSASTIGTKVFQYVDFESVDIRPAYNIYASFTPIVQANNWWLYQNGTSGTIVDSPNNSNYLIINQTHWSPVDPATGFTPFQAAANYSYNMFIAGTAAHPRNAAPDMDGIYLDNVWYAPDADGDWNRDGVTDSQSDPVIQNAYRAGNADFAKETHRLGKMAIGNNGNWPLASTAANPATDPWAIGPLYQQYDGGVDEAVLGASWSYETWAGFTVAMQHYQTLMEQVAEPKLELFNQEGLTTTGSDKYDSMPYRALRYGFSWALMNDGYYAGEAAPYHVGPSYGTKVWFDEYDAGGLGQGYLGQPTPNWKGAVQTQARWNYGPLGVWAREFQGGIAIMNPKGNGPVTLTIQDLGGQIWKHFLGTEDPATNNGQDVTDSITLADRDGVILLRRHPLGNGNSHVAQKGD